VARCTTRGLLLSIFRIVGEKNRNDRQKQLSTVYGETRRTGNVFESSVLLQSSKSRRDLRLTHIAILSFACTPTRFRNNIYGWFSVRTLDECPAVVTRREIAFNDAKFTFAEYVILTGVSACPETRCWKLERTPFVVIAVGQTVNMYAYYARRRFRDVNENKKRKRIVSPAPDGCVQSTGKREKDEYRGTNVVETSTIARSRWRRTYTADADENPVFRTK